MNTLISRLLDELQQKYDTSENEYQRKIIKRLVTIVEKYIP